VAGDVGSAEFEGVTVRDPIAQAEDYGRALGLGVCGWGSTVSAALGCAWSAGLGGV